MDDIYTDGDETALTTDQVRRLAIAIEEDFGEQLSRTDFCDKLLLTLEDVAGFDVASPTAILIELVWTAYRVGL